MQITDLIAEGLVPKHITKSYIISKFYLFCFPEVCLLASMGKIIHYLYAFSLLTTIHNMNRVCFCTSQQNAFIFHVLIH